MIVHGVPFGPYEISCSYCTKQYRDQDRQRAIRLMQEHVENRHPDKPLPDQEETD